MRKHENKPVQQSPAKTEISGALNDNDLEKVTGGFFFLNFGRVKLTYTEQ